MSDKPTRHWYQFSLRTLLVLTAMVACFFAGWKTREIATYVPTEPVTIDGIVIGKKENLYELSVGSDDAVAPGTVFSVSRKGQKLGEIVVLKTGPDRCVGLLKEPKAAWTASYFVQSESVAIQKGDSARANISREQLDETWRQNRVRR